MRELLKDFFVGTIFMIIFAVGIMIIPNISEYEYTISSIFTDTFLLSISILSLGGMMVLVCFIGGTIRKLIASIKSNKKEVLD